MSVDLRAAAVEYLATRRARGYQLADHDWLLASFLDGLDARGLTTISVTEAMVFARARPTTQLGWQAARLRVVRDLAAYVHALDPAAAQLIPARLLPDKVTRRIPYLYSDEQVAAFMTAAGVATFAFVVLAIAMPETAPRGRSMKPEAGLAGAADAKVSSICASVARPNGRPA